MYIKDTRILFKDIRKLALQAGVEDTKVAIGLWAKTHGYIKRQSKDKNHKTYTYYVSQ